MRLYEVMVIFDTEVPDTAVNAVLDRALEALRAHGGQPGRVDRWGRRQFAYEMRHRHEGYYVVVEFTGSPEAAAELDRVLGLADEVLRHKVVRLPDRLARRSTPSGGRAARPAEVG